MTLGNVLRTLRTRWYVAAAGTLLTLVGVLVLSGRTGVYTTTADVQLIPPERMTSTGSPSPVVGLVGAAGMVEREVGDDVHRTEPVSPDAPLAGLGVKSGTLITLPDWGGKAEPLLEVPALRVQTVATTAEEATATVATPRSGRSRRSCSRSRRSDGVAPRSRVTIRLFRKLAPVVHERGSVLAQASSVWCWACCSPRSRRCRSTGQASEAHSVGLARSIPPPALDLLGPAARLSRRTCHGDGPVLCGEHGPDGQGPGSTCEQDVARGAAARREPLLVVRLAGPIVDPVDVRVVGTVDELRRSV